MTRPIAKPPGRASAADELTYVRCRSRRGGYRCHLNEGHDWKNHHAWSFDGDHLVRWPKRARKLRAMKGRKRCV